MPIRYSVEPPGTRVEALVEGMVTQEEIRSTIAAIATDPRIAPDFEVLSDHRRIERTITPEQSNEAVALLRSFGSRFSTVRWAVVTVRPASYAMMRLLASRAALEMDLQVAIFTDRAEAERWLRSGGPALPR